MPHYKVDPATAAEFAEMAGDDPPEDSELFTYEPAEATINFNAVAVGLRNLRDALVELGYDVVECTYDGGYDEGFAHFDAAFGADGGIDASALSERFTQGAGLLKESPWINPSLPERANQAHVERWQTTAHDQRVTQWLDVLADTLASKLLGAGYGTGEAAIRGRLRCELKNGHITDVEENPPASDYW